MAQAIKSEPDEAVKIDPDEYKEDLRLELLILLDELRRLGFCAVAEIEKILNDTYAIPAKDQILKLQGWIRRMGKVMANLLQGLAAQ
jgi:hypothetical protein